MKCHKSAIYDHLENRRFSQCSNCELKGKIYASEIGEINKYLPIKYYCSKCIDKAILEALRIRAVK